MNCERVDQLLPLYVGGDLEEERSSLVAVHLQSCTECARAADEYADANQLLQQYEPPFFSDGVYAGIRKRVFDEIERKSQAPVWTSGVLQVFAPLVQSRMRWITAALLLVMSVAAFYIIANRSNEPSDEQQAIDGPGTGEGNAADSRAGSKLKDNNSDASPSPSSKGADILVSTAPALRGKKVGNATNRSRQQKTFVDVAQRGILTSRTEGRKPLVSPNKRLVHSDVDVWQPSSAPAPLRVEMQTSDPNIRIIWLSSQRPEARVRENSKGI